MEHHLNNLKIQNLIENYSILDNTIFSINNNSIVAIKDDALIFSFFVVENLNKSINDTNIIKLYNLIEWFIKEDYIESFIFLRETGTTTEEVRRNSILTYNIKNLILKHNFKIKFKKVFLVN